MDFGPAVTRPLAAIFGNRKETKKISASLTRLNFLILFHRFIPTNSQKEEHIKLTPGVNVMHAMETRKACLAP